MQKGGNGAWPCKCDRVVFGETRGSGMEFQQLGSQAMEKSSDLLQVGRKFFGGS